MPPIAPGSVEKPAVCPLDCADTCSLTIDVKDGQLQKVRGSNDNPFTRGKICAKVATGLPEQVHGKDRLLKPQRRVGTKGPGATFEDISWQEALDTIFAAFQKNIAEHGAESIVPLAYGGPMGLLAGGSMDKRFFNRLGARKVNSAPLCAGVTDAAYESLFGDTGGITYAELGESGLIVIWGNNITACHLHLTKIIRDAQKDGARLVVVDPKRTRIAAHADLHLPIMPGTDVVLGYAVAAELNRQGALDDEFINNHVAGSEKYLAEAEQFSLEMAAKICGLKLEDIQQFVSYWRDIKPAGLSIGIGPERNRNGGSGIRTALALPALTGNFGPKGAGVCNVGSFFPTDSDPLTRDDLYAGPDNEISILDIPDLVLEENGASRTPIKSLFIYNHNPVAVHPRQHKMQAALMRDDLFIVGCDISMTDSMQYADILLPAASHVEHSDVYQAYGHPYLQQSDPAIDPVGEALPNTEIFRRLAKRFGFTDQVFMDSDQELINQAIDLEHPAMEGRDRSALSPQSPLDCQFDHGGTPTPTLFRGQSPDTASGKIELYSTTLEQECGQGLPVWKPLIDNFDFILVSPSSEKRTNSTFGNVEGHDSDLVLEMHPNDAEERQLSDNQVVRIFNQQGNVTLPIKITDTVKPGTLYTPKGAWLKSQKNTINVLIPGHKADIAGGACYNDTRVNVEAL